MPSGAINCGGLLGRALACQSERSSPSALAIHSMQPPPGGAGNRVCRRPFRPPSNLNKPLTQLARIFSGFVSRRHRAAKPEEFVSKPGGRLKAGDALWAQPGLAASRKAKAESERSSTCRFPGRWPGRNKRTLPSPLSGPPARPQQSRLCLSRRAYLPPESVVLSPCGQAGRPCFSMSWVGYRLTVGELRSLWQAEARPTKSRLQPARWNP